MDVSIEQLQDYVEILQQKYHCQPITKGYSQDQKYMVTTHTGETRLLRVMPREQYDRKREEFAALKHLLAQGVRVPVPLSIGTFDTLSVCFYVLSYIEGEDAEEAIGKYPPKIQRCMGVEAGKDLRVIHEHRAPASITPWEDRVTKKARSYIEAYKAMGIRVQRANDIILFIEDHLCYVRDRPNRLQHDDFHLANIIVDEGRYAGVIDFNRFDWGDPVHDFLKLSYFSSPLSVPFSVGQIRGYFQNAAAPRDFWILYNLYVAISVFSSVVWTMKVVPDTMSDMLQRIHRVLDDHGYFTYATPAWYTE